MKVILKGDDKKIKAFLKKESLYMKRNSIELVENRKSSEMNTEIITQVKDDSKSDEPKKRGPKPKN